MSCQVATRVVDTGGAAGTTVIERGPAVLFHLDVSPETIDTAGVLKVYNGRGTDGRLVRQIETGRSRDCNFSKGVPCPGGIFVTHDANIACWSVDYEPVG